MRLFVTLALALASAAPAEAGPFRRCRDRRQQCHQTLTAPAPACAVPPAAAAPNPDWRPAILPGFGQLGTPRGVPGPFTAGGCPGGVCPTK